MVSCPLSHVLFSLLAAYTRATLLQPILPAKGAFVYATLLYHVIIPIQPTEMDSLPGCVGAEGGRELGRVHLVLSSVA